jgi:hypothetical protein
MAKETSNMWFICINTVDDATDFSEWLNGKLKRFNDTMEFTEWMNAYNAFPLDIYLDGVHYTFKCRNEATFFLCGFETAMRLNLK